MGEVIDRPETFTDSVIAVLKILLKERDQFERDERDFVATYHNNLGRWMRNEWGLWAKTGGLYDWFHSVGIGHPDDMSGIILTSAYRGYNEIERDLAGQLRGYREYWIEQGIHPLTQEKM